MRGLLMGSGKSAATGTGLTSVRDADIGGQTIGLLGREEEDAFAAFDDGADHREDGQEGEVVFDLERHVGHADKAGAALERVESGDGLLGTLAYDREVSDDAKAFVRNLKQQGILRYRDKEVPEEDPRSRFRGRRR